MGYFTFSGSDGTVKRPKILITAGITEPLALLSVQQCNHQLSTCNAQVASDTPGEGRGGRGSGATGQGTDG